MFSGSCGNMDVKSINHGFKKKKKGSTVSQGLAVPPLQNLFKQLTD